MANTPAGTYELRDGSGGTVGKVRVDPGGGWNYEGRDGGRNSGNSWDPLPDRTSFKDSSGNRVAVRNNDGSVSYEHRDPKTGSTESRVGSLQPVGGGQ